jgi:hypothetical protein
MIRKSGVLLAALAALAVVLPTGTASADQHCAITWGSEPRSAQPTTRGPMVGLTAGRHECYDRLVFHVRTSANGYHVRYVDEMHEDVTGTPIPLRGDARLSVTVHAPAYDENLDSTYTYEDRAELVDVSDFETFRQVAWGNSWEGTSTVGLGVRDHLPFRVLVVPGGIVIDVAHGWGNAASSAGTATE